MASVSELTALVQIISSGVQNLEAVYSSKGIPYPSLDEPQYVPNELESSPELSKVRALIVAAAAQLIASVRTPTETELELFPSMLVTSVLGAVVETHLPDVLKGAGKDGLHVKEIASKTGVDEGKTARLLRYLASRHVFREVVPNVFANNRFSSILCKAKSLDEIKADPIAAYDGAPAAAFASQGADEAFKCAAMLSKFLQGVDSNIGSPFNLAFPKYSSFWELYEQPKNRLQARRFQSIMKGSGEALTSPALMKIDFWSNLTENDVVVDVGGNIGSVTLLLTRQYPKPHFVVQDLDNVIIDAKTHWDNEYPEAVTTGRVKLQAHSFFEPQPVENASIYFLRMVLHDWSKKESQDILRLLRQAANTESRLVIFEGIMPHACEEPPAMSMVGRQHQKMKVPYPLLANLGAGKGALNTMMDMQMMCGFTGQERTIEEWIDLGNATGWKLEMAYESTAKVSGLVYIPV